MSQGKQTSRKLLERVRGKRVSRWPWPRRRAADHRPWWPHEETGWTGHGVVALRREGRSICEFTRLAVDTSRVSRRVLAGLFHTVSLYDQRIDGFDFVVIEVNPRHVGYYQRVPGFDVIGGPRHNPRVGAPPVLMGVSFQKIGDKLHRCDGRGMRATRTRNPYVYRFSPSEEAGILGRPRPRDAG